MVGVTATDDKPVEVVVTIKGVRVRVLVTVSPQKRNDPARDSALRSS